MKMCLALRIKKKAIYVISFTLANIKTFNWF